MANRKVVVALGRNAFGKSLPEQKQAVKHAACAIADLVEAHCDVVITHSNGTQVGMLHTAMTEFGEKHEGFTVAPMSVCSAMSQGYIGFDLQNEIRTELLNRGIFKTVSTIITQVKVDPFDSAFNKPIKTIGRILNEEEAEIERKKGHTVVPVEQGYQRAIASPSPIEIYEIDAIRLLANAGQVVIAAGGGGIPVIEQGTQLKGASAVIEKDATAAKLAHELNADMLLFLTGSEKLTIEYENGTTSTLDTLTLSDAHELIDSGNLSVQGLLPKITAATNFVSTGEYRKAIITSLDKAKDGVDGKTGTVIR